jgi:hypothetical protein
MGDETWRKGHEDHPLDMTSMSWGERAECDPCAVTLAVWNDAGELLWQQGDPVRDLHHYLAGRDYPEAR